VLDAAGEGAGAPAVPNRDTTTERRNPTPTEAAGEGAGAQEARGNTAFFLSWLMRR
jgi:hypothetical protein